MSFCEYCGKEIKDGTRYCHGHNNGGKHFSEVHKRKIGLSNEGKIRSKETIKKLEDSHKNQNKGIPCPEDRKLKISKSEMGKIVLDETRKKIRDNHADMSGDKNPNWQGGISFEPYCFKFNEITKRKIRARDNYQCQMPGCLCSQLESLVLYKKVLTVHHIHYDKPNCKPDLITLCISCNSKVNKNRNYWEEFFTKILRERKL